MAGSSIKLGVDVTDFKRGMSEAQASVKTLDATIKTNEKSMQLYGKSESYVSTQAGLLNQKLKEQEKIVKNAESSLKAMEQNGVSKSSRAYQDMERKLMEARGAMIDTTVQLNQLTTGEAEAAKGADQLANSVGGISKKMSLEQVIGGIDSVTQGIENAARSAVELGEKLFSAVMESAAAADDISTMATRLGLTDEQVQKINYNAGRFEVTAEQLGTTWKKVKNNMASDSKEVQAAFEELGVKTHEILPTKYGDVQGAARDYIDVFWEVGEAIMKVTDEADKERLAMKLLGRNWDELKPLFKAGRKEYEAALEAAPAATEDAVESAASLKDRVGELEASWNTLKLEVIGSIAPALEKGADAIAKVLDSITKYLQTDEGQELLKNLGDAVSGLFADLEKIDPDKVVRGFVEVFTKVTDGIQWLVDNADVAKGILGTIVAGWGLLTIGENVLKIINFIDGIRGLGAGSAAAAGAAAGSSWGSAFAGAVLKAAPWLAGLIALLTPAGTESDDVVNREGQLTEGGMNDFRRDRENFFNLAPEDIQAGLANDNNLYRLITEAGKYVQEASRLWIDENSWQALASFAQSGDVEKLKEDLQGLGYVLQEVVQDAGENMPQTDVENDKTKAVFKNRKTGEIEKIIEDGFTDAPGITIDPVVPDDAAETVAEEIGTVTVPVHAVVEEITGADMEAFFNGVPKANGMWAVPRDNYLARLHKGEQIVPAREVASRSFSSNLYIESMVMNNGTDVDGLAARVAAQNRRVMNGYGN